MANGTIAELERSIFRLNQSGRQAIPITTGQVVVNKALYKTLGPFYDLYRNLISNLKTLMDVFKAILKPITLFKGLFDAIRGNLFFLIGVITLVGLAFVAMGDKIGGVGDALTIFDGLLQGTGITVTDLKSTFDAFVNGVVVTFEALGVAWSVFVANLQQTGLLDSLMTAFDGLGTGVSAIFASVNEAFAILGIEGGNLGETFTNIINGVFAFLTASGFIEYFNELIVTFGMLGETAGIVIGAIIVLIANIVKEATTSGTMLNTIVKGIGTVIGGVLNVVYGTATFVLKGIQLLFQGVQFIATGGIGEIADFFSEKFGDMYDSAVDFKDGVSKALSGMFDFLMTPIDYILDKIDELKNIDLGSIVPDLGDITGGLASLNPFAQGGIARGPDSGYAVALHGTEAVVPLPDGRTIPVTLQGAEGMGGGFTANITVNSTGGDPNAIARAVSMEVQKAFRSRSRSGGYGRGI